MSEISTKPPSGMRDFLAPDVARRRHVLAVVQRVYESFGFVPLETPTIENLSTLLGKYGPEGDQLLYRILHRREKLQRALAAGNTAAGGVGELELADEGLRYDLTVPLARVVANYRDLPAYYKRYQIQAVWRADRPGKGRFREFWQCDVDITGTASVIADAEVVGAIARVLQELGFPDFKIHCNHRELLRGFVANAGIEPASEGQALIALDKLDKVGRDGVLKELGEKGFSAEQSTTLLNVLEHARVDGLASVGMDLGAKGHANLERGRRDLHDVMAAAADGPASKHLVFDPTLARGLSSYTGPIFEISVDGLAGSMGGGGRYDRLIGMFKKQQVPAVGFSLGLERVLLVMEERGMFPPLGVGPQVLLCPMKDVDAPAIVRTATQLRAHGLRVEVFADNHKPLGKQLDYANTLAAPFAAILGKTELAADTVALKHLQSGEQTTVAVADVARHVAQRS